MIPSQTPVDIDCYVRASALVDPVDATIETLRDYEASGVIGEFSVTAWPEEVATTGETDNGAVLDRYERFMSWADRRGVDLEPAFTRRERTTLVSDVADTVLVLPAQCLAIHVDGELASVVPHRGEEGTYTVDDALADVEDLVVRFDPGRHGGSRQTYHYGSDSSPKAVAPTAGGSPQGPSRSPSTGRTPEGCPSCGDDLLTGQGLYACRACSWSSTTPVGGDVDAHGETGEHDPREPERSEDSPLGDADEELPPPST